MALTNEQLVTELSNKTVLEIAELVKNLEEKWGVSAAAPVMMAGGASAAPVEEKDEFTIILQEVPADKKINIIKEVRAITGLGLGEAKALVEAAPKNVKEGVKKDEAQKIKKQLEDAGAKVKLD